MTPPSSPSSPRRFLIEAVLFLSYAVFGLSWIAVTPLLGELQREFSVSSAELGMLNTMVAVAKVIAPLLTGALAVRLGLKRTIALGMVLTACAVVAPLAHGFPLFLGSRFVFGIGGAVIVTLLGPMVMQWFPRGELPIVNALNNVAANTGIALTLFITGPLAARFGWRATLLGYALVGIALTLAWLLAGRDRAATPAATATGGKPPSTVRYLDVWARKETWLVAVAFTGPLALYLAFNTWLPRHYIESLGMDKGAASRYTGLVNLVGIPTAIAGGFLTQYFGRRRPFLILGGTLVGLAAFGMIFGRQPAVLLLAAVLLGVAFFIGTASLFTTAMELPGVTPAHVSLIMGTVFSTAYTVSALSPTLVGWLRDRTGSFVPGLSVWAGFAAVLLPCALLLPETGPGRRKPEAATRRAA